MSLPIKTGGKDEPKIVFMRKHRVPNSEDVFWQRDCTDTDGLGLVYGV